MRLTAYVMLLLCLNIGGYFMGMKSNGVTLLEDLYAAQGGQGLSLMSIMQKMADSVLNSNGALAALGIGAAIAAVATTLALGFGSVYVLPLALLVGVISFLVFPFNWIFIPELDVGIKVVVVVLFNTLTVLALVNFVRGGGT